MFDSHAHVGFSGFDEDRAEVVSRARAAGLSGWLEIGTDLDTSQGAIDLASGEEGVFAAVGIHPGDIAGIDELAWRALDQMSDHERVVAIGEVGFDFYHQANELEQHAALIRFIELAQTKKLPLIFHVRDGQEKSAHSLLLQVLADVPKADRPNGVIHTFSGSVSQAERYLALGMHLSFSGVVTFKNAGEITEVAKSMPLDRMLVETDCPFLAPEPYRGKRNEPAYVVHVAEKIAQLRGVSVEEIEAATDGNTKKLFKV